MQKLEATRSRVLLSEATAMIATFEHSLLAARILRRTANDCFIAYDA
jgi:hypothetical protein